MKRLILLLAFLPLIAAPAADDPFSSPFGDSSDAEEWTQASLVSELGVIEAGRPFDVALVLKHPDGWHSYYKNSGGLEQSPGIDWDLPEGFTAGPIRWPVPEVIENSLGGKSIAYSGEVTLLVEITPPAELESGSSHVLTAKPHWQICKMTCKDEPNPDAPQEFQIEVTAGSEPVKNPGAAALISAARAKLPRQSDAWDFHATRTGNGFALRLSPQDDGLPDLSKLELEFIPDVPYVAPFSDGGSLERDGDDWVIRLKRLTEIPLIEIPIEQGDTISGILVADQALDPAGNRDVRVPEIGFGERAASPSATDGDQSGTPGVSLPKLLAVLAGMFVGGLILNLMPCVFPVIGLKIMGFVQQAGEDRKKIVLHGLVFTLGVLVSFWILSGILLAGGIRNWGGQLENPVVVFSLLLVMLVMGLSMSGVFEFGTSATGVGGSLAARQGLAGSFFSGVLATVVATPCSAPFLGGALGVAVTLPAPLFMLAFTLMALGLSLPYLLLSIFPQLVDRLPRPGPWMESFKQGMSFLLFGTVGYLLWVYSFQVFEQDAGQKGLWVVLGLTLLSAGFWVYGRWDLPSRSTRARWAGRVIAVVFIAVGVWAGWPGQAAGAGDVRSVEIAWRKWTPELQQNLIDEGKPVYIDFTARWCLTCQTNKAATYTEAMARFFKERGIVALKADKTSTRPDIDEELRRLGKTAIPVNVFYAPGSDQPQLTHTVLNESYLRSFLEKRLPEPGAAPSEAP